MKNRNRLFGQLAGAGEDETSGVELTDGSRVATVGGGPAGSFFAYFLLDMAEKAGIDVEVDIFESRDFTRPGPAGCNMCGGIISESLVQSLAAEGINLPSSVVQRGIDSYVLHTDLGDVRIETPLHEKRIAAVHRGPGPRDVTEIKWESFDGYLQSLALKKGANLVKGRVDKVSRENGKPQVQIRGGTPETYDLLAVTVGVNSPTLKLFKEFAQGYNPPKTVQTFIREYKLGEETIKKYLGSSMHVFLLDIPGLEFAAIIPKGDYVTVCMMGDIIDAKLQEKFLNGSEVRSCMPPGWKYNEEACHCSPRMNVAGAAQPYAERTVFIGDCGVTRLYKDGLGAAYRAAKAAASTAVFQGVSREDFGRHYLPTCRAMSTDNSIGKFIFWVTGLIQKSRIARLAVLDMTFKEQRKTGNERRMSVTLWDMFTGSAPYKEIFIRTLHPLFISNLIWNIVTAIYILMTDRSLKETV